MTRYLTIVAMAGLVVLAACKDSTEPDARGQIALISQIDVPEQTKVRDTVRLSFYYASGSCDSTAVEIRQGETQLRFTALSYPTQRPCVQDLMVELHRFDYTVYPPHYSPLNVIFTEPTGGDSLRVVQPTDVITVNS